MNFIELLEQMKWLPSLKMRPIDFIQIIIITLALYYLAKNLYKTRAWILVKGMMIIGVVYLIICLTDMAVLRKIMSSLFSTLMIAIIIMLQPELQRIVELIGKKKLIDIESLIFKKQEIPAWYSERTIREIAMACEKMGSAKTGALIVIERDIPLTDCVNSGIKLESLISRQLLLNIFEKNTPLHDGAVIISDDKIESATSYLPLSTNTNIDKNLGTRHRAALGISETTDAIVIVVSEETGAVSFCADGKINHGIDRQELVKLLKANAKKSDEKVVANKKSKSPTWMKVLAPIMGVIIWVMVTASADPIMIKTIYDIPVNTINTEMLDDMGQAYTINSGNTISVKVKGRRSLVDYMEAEHLVATADFTEISMVYAVPIKVKPVSGYEDVEVVSGQSVMSLSIEEMVQTTIKIDVNVVGDNNNDYVVVLDELETDTITVTCPQSIAKTLDKAVVSIDASDRSGDFIATSSPTLYDKNGDKVVGNTIHIDNETVAVSVNVYDVQSVPVKIALTPQDTTADEYYVIDKCVPEFELIRVAGNDEVLMNMQEILIVVDPATKNEGADSLLVNLSQHIPEECYLAKDQTEQMSVDLALIKYKKMKIKLAPNDIKVTGYDANTTDVEILQAPQYIELYYNANTVDEADITLDTLNPTIKTKNVVFGKYESVITMTDIDGVTLTKELVAQYILSAKSGQ